MPSFVRNSKFFSAFSSAASQYSSAIGSSHSFPEAVFISSFALRRLKRSFHDAYGIFYFPAKITSIVLHVYMSISTHKFYFFIELAKIGNIYRKDKVCVLKYYIFSKNMETGKYSEYVLNQSCISTSLAACLAGK